MSKRGRVKEWFVGGGWWGGRRVVAELNTNIIVIA